jgi:outer membrane protein assembly factor BamA
MKPPLALLSASMLLAAGLACAQDALRYSLAGDAAAEAQRQQQASQQASGLYTYKAGDFRLLAVPSLELDYNDNITLVKTGTQSDFILKPLLQVTGSYPISQQNLLSFTVGVGYDEYLEHSQYSAFRVDSDSLLSFDMRIKDFLINFHDRISYSQDSGTEAALAGTAVYGGLVNGAGLSTTWDLEDVTLTLGYDHQNTVSSSGEFSYLNYSSELPLARAGFRFRPDLTAGVEGSASFTTYDQEVLNDNQSYSAGLYADWNPGLYFHVQPRAGYTIYQFQHTSQSAQIYDLSLSGAPILAPPGESIQTADLDSWYADLTVSHEISKAASYGFSAGHEIRLGIQSDVIEDWYFRPNITWTIFKDLGLNTSLFYEHGNEGVGNVTGNLTETYDWYGGALMVSYPLMKKLKLSLNYRLTLRSSDIPSMEYTQNLVGLRLTYQAQ